MDFHDVFACLWAMLVIIRVYYDLNYAVKLQRQSAKTPSSTDTVLMLLMILVGKTAGLCRFFLAGRDSFARRLAVFFGADSDRCRALEIGQ